MKTQKGLSEIISAVIVIAVVISSIGIYTIASSQRILNDALSVKEVLQLSEDQVSEMLEDINISIKNDTHALVYVYNYGLKNMTITKLFVNSTALIVSSDKGTTDVFVFDLDNNDQDLVIPSGKTVKLTLKTASIVNPVTHIKNVAIITDSNKVFEIIN